MGRCPFGAWSLCLLALRDALPGAILMNAYAWIEVTVFLAALVALAKPLGWFMARIHQGEPCCGLDRVLGPVERLIYRVCGISQKEEMTWKHYAGAALVFNLLGLLAVYGLQRFQASLPLNPQKL